MFFADCKPRRFTPMEDAMIKELVKVKKIRPWSKVAEYLPGRTGAQCRDRYNSALYQRSEHRKWTQEEDDLLVQKYKEYGPRWVFISKFFNGRNGNNIKNRWYKALCQFHNISHHSIKQIRRNKDIKHIKDEISKAPNALLFGIKKNSEKNQESKKPVKTDINVPVDNQSEVFDIFDSELFDLDLSNCFNI